MTQPPFPRLDPSPRLLAGPGPSNVPESVREVMQRSQLGHLDPEFWDICSEVVTMLAEVYRRPSGITFPLSATGTSGIEAVLNGLLSPADTVIVAVAGFFGNRLAEIARRRGANVVVVEAPLGQTVPNDALLDALAQHPEARAVAVVHAETSTGARHPLRELADALAGSETLLFADCVTSLGGIELEPETWGVDACVSCTQKCLGAPPGMAPLSLSERAFERVRAQTDPVPLSLDLELIARYWLERPAPYHHTAPILHVYALHEALRLVLEEGLEARWRRHEEVGRYLQNELRARGFELLADEEVQLPQLTAVCVPEGVDGREVQLQLAREHGIEVGGGLGPSAPPIWRIGTMGVNATIETADRILEALDAVVARPRGLARASR
ncbi:MAG: alanine--glyoxylate aminotransferase family protein [Thermoleophilia bacterium]|nr:alanine--glyoxylate aminotransferase family protein [Thermoleophilia bacterium]